MQETGAVPQKEEKDLLKIFGGVVLVIILLGIVAYGITPIRQSITSWWQDMQNAQNMRELQEFAETQPQGTLTVEEKQALINIEL
jgi:flagellar basal body-associated protein FliL